MKRLFWLVLLIFLTGCTLAQSESARPTERVSLPEFVDDPIREANEDLSAPRQKLIYYRNHDAIEQILKHDPKTVRPEMEKRLAPSEPISLRLIAAAVLVLQKDELGKKFFLDQSKIHQNLGELYCTLNYMVWSAHGLTGSEMDLSWAEDFMIEALQNRTRVKREEAIRFQQNIHWQDETIEIRELAIQYGEFSDHLTKMGSEKALPVILALLQEYPSYQLNSCIARLGNYKDERVPPLILDFLSRHQDSEHEDTYRYAVHAASQMGLKAALPVLLSHLDDNDSYEGLRVLADETVIPTIKNALPRLKSYARAEAELALIDLQGGDMLPSLLQLLNRRAFLKRDDVLMRLEKLRDPRSVSRIASALCDDKDWFVRSWSIRVLAAVKNREAIEGLVNGLGCDYSDLERPKTNSDYDYNREYRDRIAKTLKEITGQNFGVDQKSWALWLNEQATGFDP